MLVFQVPFEFFELVFFLLVQFCQLFGPRFIALAQGHLFLFGAHALSSHQFGLEAFVFFAQGHFPGGQIVLVLGQQGAELRLLQLRDLPVFVDQAELYPAHLGFPGGQLGLERLYLFFELGAGGAPAGGFLVEDLFAQGGLQVRLHGGLGLPVLFPGLYGPLPFFEDLGFLLYLLGERAVQAGLGAVLFPQAAELLLQAVDLFHCPAERELRGFHVGYCGRV